MFFNLIKEVNNLRKEINRLLSKAMLNIYLKTTVEEKWRTQNFQNFSSWFSKFKKFVSRWNFGEHQLTKILFEFQTSCCNLKTKGLGAKLFVDFYCFLFWKELWHFNPWLVPREGVNLTPPVVFPKKYLLERRRRPDFFWIFN